MSQRWDSLCVNVLIQGIVRRLLLAKWAAAAHFGVCIPLLNSLSLGDRTFNWTWSFHQCQAATDNCELWVEVWWLGRVWGEQNGEIVLGPHAGTWSQSFTTVGTKKACCGKFALQMNYWVWDIPISSSCMNISGQSLNFRVTWGMAPGFHFVESLVM